MTGCFHKRLEINGSRPGILNPQATGGTDRAQKIVLHVVKRDAATAAAATALSYSALTAPGGNAAGAAQVPNGDP